MFKISKKPILIPENVELKIENNFLKTKGPKGEAQREIPQKVSLEIKGNELFVLPEDSLKILSKKSKSILGLYYRIFKNDITGVTSGFEKELEIQGIGYRAQVDDNGDLILKVGFSHPVIINKEKDIKFSVDKNIISVFGIDKEKVGNMAAKIRRIKPPDHYKGKGIRYLGETIRKKEGKKAITAAK